MRRIALALVGSIATAAYWWAVFIAVYADALFAGDRAPGARPAADHDVVARNTAILVAGVVGYAGLSLLWRRLAAGRHRV